MDSNINVRTLHETKAFALRQILDSGLPGSDENFLMVALIDSVGQLRVSAV